MRKKVIQLIVVICSLLCIWCIIASKYAFSNLNNIPVCLLSENDSITLNVGDLLVRPNWAWLPGACSVENGRKYGHVAIVTQGASGKTIDEALGKATVIEALFFDQATRKFQIHKKDQIREGKASVSFGKRFKGIRYRLRMNLNEVQKGKMITFLRNQLDGGYNIFSLKRSPDSEDEKAMMLQNLKNESWHCATLVWDAYYLITGVDIDANEGYLVYPSDLIASKYFDLPGGRVRF
jgi:hypothetical protein